MDTQIPASGSPTPEALLGMLGKLKRTLTRDISEQRQSSNDKGYISAAIPGNPDRNGAPNLLRPSPGLDFLSGKTALSDGAAERPRSPVAAALELESAAPPMDLDRPSRLGSSPVPRLPLPNLGVSNLSTYTVPPRESSESAQDASNLNESREKGGFVTLAASPADASAAKVADPIGKDRPSTPVAIAEDATSASENLDRGREASSITPSEVLTLQGTRDENELSAKTDTVTESEAAGADSKSSGPLQEPQQQQEWPVKGQQEVQADAEAQLSGPTSMPVTEEGLDNAMEELALEVSQLQPSPSALVSQGSYLQRHTSSLILKMSQDTATPPLPAVAHMDAAARSEASSSQVVTPGRVAKPSDPQKTIKSMAASLFRAFDEGRLKERAPAPAATSGAPEQAEHALAATLRTYRSSPPKRREASTPPPARTSSYASRQQASLRRSLSPHAQQQTSALRKRPEPSIKPSRASATPARAAITPPRTANPPLPVPPVSDKARQGKTLHAALGQARNLVKRPSVKPSQAGGSRKRSWQPTSAAPHAFKGHLEPEVPIVEGRQAHSAHQARPVHREASSLQSRQRANALEAFGIAPPAQHTNAVQSHRPSAHAALAPAHSMTSVAALKQCFEQRSSPTVGLIDSVKPRNRLPLRKVSSKAHVVTDDGSPQQAALLWQQSLRGEPDGEDLGVTHQAETHAEHDKADHGSGRHGHTGLAGDANTIMPHLYHTMSALVSQRQASPKVPLPGMPIRASVGTSASPADQSHSVSPSRLTEALLAAADNVSSSAEKLPVSHRLPVSRSVFDSDEGSLVSSDEEVTIRNKGTANPQGCQAQPLTEEATLALLPDRGMSPVSESSGDQAASGSGQRHESESARPAGSSGPQRAQHTPRSNTDTRHEVYPWRALAWAHGPTWFRLICKLLPSPSPHFAHPLGPHLLQTSLGLHGADAKNYAFDQVLLEDCSEADVAEQASGVVEGVLQGRNSVVLALGQAGSGKSHTLLGGALHDQDASSNTGLSTTLVESLFLEIQQRRLPAEVQSVYVTAFQIMNETIQDLLQMREAEADAKQSHRRGGSASDRHDVFVDKQKRTWVSNLAAFQISSPADFANMLTLISGRRHQSSSSHPHMYTSHAPSSCIVTLLVTADVPTASVPSSARRRSSDPQSGERQSQGLPAMTTVCSKLSFVEIGSSAVASATGPMRTVSAGPLRHQLSRTSTSVSTVSSYALCSSMGDRRQSVPSGKGPVRNGAGGSRGVGRGKAQDSTMRSVSEVVWAAAHGKGVPVPNRACKLTRYLQDTLCPSGRAVGIMCVDPAIFAQAVGMPTLAASERMMPSQA
ncbi:hypothetical protein WJX82_002647 [Trebouxia sp. C0006]